MPITQFEFTQLCDQAAARLGLSEPHVVSNGEEFFIHTVPCQAMFSEIRASAYFTCEIGDPEPHLEAEVYRQVLEMQLLMIGGPDAVFARDGINNRLIFVTRLPIDVDTDPANLAQAMSAIAEQVRAWQETVLQGKLIDYERAFDEVFDRHPSNIEQVRA